MRFCDAEKQEDDESDARGPEEGDVDVVVNDEIGNQGTETATEKKMMM